MKKLPPKTKKEAAQRLIDGERFELGGDELYFDADGDGSPFLYNSVVLNGSWNVADQWQPIQEWHETVSPENPRLCWITPRKVEAALIVGFNDDLFVGATGAIYSYAEPVEAEYLTGG